jgi:hypothetical protein
MFLSSKYLSVPLISSWFRDTASPPHKYEAGGSPLNGCPQLLIRHIRGDKGSKHRIKCTVFWIRNVETQLNARIPFMIRWFVKKEWLPVVLQYVRLKLQVYTVRLHCCKKRQPMPYSYFDYTKVTSPGISVHLYLELPALSQTSEYLDTKSVRIFVSDIYRM